LLGRRGARTKLEAVISEGADVVLLDEPTNDLDFASIELLERFVESHHGGLVAVSHDRVFLELMTRIIEVDAEPRRTREFAGGWSAFDAEHRLARERHQESYRRSAAERRRVEEQARRMREWEQRGYGQGRKKKKMKDVKRTFERKLSRVE
jgi:ATPase subunit of ABC transporter with duplicated ATPase domains